MVINAYVLVAEPSWIEASISSYYAIVDTIVVSYDRSGRGWTGAPIAVDECLDRLRAIDSARKMRFCPGEYARPGHTPMENDTYQRQQALEAAGAGADWVLAIDTDEVLPDAARFARRLRDMPAGFAADEVVLPPHGRGNLIRKIFGVLVNPPIGLRPVLLARSGRLVGGVGLAPSELVGTRWPPGVLPVPPCQRGVLAYDRRRMERGPGLRAGIFLA
jgi:hypothetical protein